MSEAYTNQEAYCTYRDAQQKVLDGKALVKVLRAEWEKAGEQAKYGTRGTLQEKLEAIRIAIAPYREQIAQVEAEIKENYAIADLNFDIWKGLINE
jgi:hypothetical protein